MSASTNLRPPVAIVLLAALCYLTPLYEAVAGFPLDANDAYVSELAARDQPFGWVFRTTDFAAGVLLLTAAVAAWRPRAIQRWDTRLLIGGYVTAAIATIGDVIFPMDCAESITTCQRAVQRGAVSISHHIHLLSSTIAVIAFVCAGVAAAWVARTQLPTRYPLVLLAVLVMVATLAVQGICFALDIGLGWPQRIHVIATAALIALSGPLLEKGERL